MGAKTTHKLILCSMCSITTTTVTRAKKRREEQVTDMLLESHVVDLL